MTPDELVKKGMRVKIIISEPRELATDPLEATVISSGSTPDAPSVLSVLLKLDWPVRDRVRKNECLYLIARPRGGQGLDQVATGSTVEAIFTGIPYDRALSQKYPPLDLSWWREGLKFAGSIFQMVFPFQNARFPTKLHPKALALEWSPCSVRLVGLPHGETVATLSIPAAVGTTRFDLVLYSGSERGPILRVPSVTREQFVRIGLDTLETIPRIPGERELSATNCRVHPGGVLTAIDGEQIWILGDASEAWSAHRLPDGITARDVSFAPDGTLWVAGRDCRDGAKPTAVLLHVKEQGEEVLSLKLSDKDRRSLAKRGADEDFWKVDMEGTPGILEASCPWFYEDSSDFTLVGWDAGWEIVNLKRKATRNWVRDRGLTLYMSDERYQVSGYGESPQRQNLRRALRAAWPEGPTRKLSIRTVRARGNELLLVMSAYDWNKPEPHHILGSAIFYSTDDGQSFHPWAQTIGHHSQLLDVIWL